MEPSKADERYRQTRQRTNRRTSFIVMLIGLFGCVILGAVFVIAFTQGFRSVHLALLLVASIVIFIGGLTGWLRGDRRMGRNWDPFGE